MSRGLALLCLIGLMALAAPAAQAATVSVTPYEGPPNKGPGPIYHVLEFKAQPGEQNAVTLSAIAAGKWTVRDGGADVNAGPGCMPVAVNEALCSAFDSGGVLLGDGDDSFSISGSVGPGLGFRVEGGDGSDRLTGGDGNETLYGGAGDDVVSAGRGLDSLDGGGGHDQLRGGDGSDYLSDGDVPGSADADFMDGGAGSDAVTYGSRTAAVTVDLGDPLAPAGEAGEGDALSEIESVTTGDGDDVLLGSDGTDTFEAGSGANRVESRGGNDFVSGAGMIDGGEGDDSVECAPIPGCTIVGGPGNDDLQGSNVADAIDGGPGSDRLIGYTGSDTLSGGDGADRLEGGNPAPGARGTDDTLDGGAGADFLLGGLGKDVYKGGAGADRIESFDGVRDTIGCGGGRDSVRGDRVDAVTACDNVTHEFAFRLGAKSMTVSFESPFVSLSCPDYALTGCRFEAILSTPGGRRLAHERESLESGQVDDMLMGLSADDTRAFRRARRLSARITLIRTIGAETATAQRSYRLKYRRL